MTTFANQLKSEIARIAKKEARAETQQLKKASAQYRSDIAALKRHIAALEATVKKLSKGQPKPDTGTNAEPEPASDVKPAAAVTSRPCGVGAATAAGQLIEVQIYKHEHA